MAEAMIARGMIARGLGLSLMASLALMALPAVAAEADGPAILSLSVTETVNARPDMASVSAGVVTTAREAAGALAANSQQMAKVVAALRKAGIAAEDIRTSQLSLQPQYAREQGQAPQLTGFEASNQLRVRLRDVGRVGTVVDTLATAGANRIEALDFAVSNADQLLDEARSKAVQKAQARAGLYAKAAGLRVASVRRMSENTGNGPMPVARAMMASEAMFATPVEAGSLTLSLTLNMEFALAPR